MAGSSLRSAQLSTSSSPVASWSTWSRSPTSSAARSAADAYLDQLSPRSRDVMREALDTIAAVACGIDRAEGRTQRGKHARLLSSFDAHSFPLLQTQIRPQSTEQSFSGWGPSFPCDIL